MAAVVDGAGVGSISWATATPLMATQAREAAIPRREIPIVQPSIVSSEIELTTITFLSRRLFRVALVGGNADLQGNTEGNGKRVERAGLRWTALALYVTR